MISPALFLKVRFTRASKRAFYIGTPDEGEHKLALFIRYSKQRESFPSVLGSECFHSQGSKCCTRSFISCASIRYFIAHIETSLPAFHLRDAVTFGELFVAILLSLVHCFASGWNKFALVLLQRNVETPQNKTFLMCVLLLPPSPPPPFIRYNTIHPWDGLL